MTLEEVYEHLMVAVKDYHNWNTITRQAKALVRKNRGRKKIKLWPWSLACQNKDVIFRYK